MFQNLFTRTLKFDHRQGLVGESEVQHVLRVKRDLDLGRLVLARESQNALILEREGAATHFVSNNFLPTTSNHLPLDIFVFDLQLHLWQNHNALGV
jgi:hypothetical protein